MPNISPLTSRMMTDNTKQNEHQEKIYKHLAQHANDVKPNEAKARLVKENPLQSAASAVGDTFKDGKNFVIAAKTGKLNDNSLGRINDLGLKAEALLIAGFLASNAKTKTNAIMQFLGGATFLSVMSLWPKIFINLPARLVHGFRIDQKYISAQGDKKDVYLDNQFIPTDIFSKQELKDNARRSGIDYESENGEEKILRKMQKTALQNRTLWMATAGFATPLLTAVIGDKIEPLVKNAVINHDFMKSRQALDNIDEVFSASSPIVKNKKQLEDVLMQYSSKNLDSEGFKKISAALNIDVTDIFKDSDDLKPIKDLKFNVDENALSVARNQVSIIKDEGLEETLKNAFSDLIKSKDATQGTSERAKGIFANVKTIQESHNGKIEAEKLDEVINNFKNLKEGKTYIKLRQMLQEAFNAQGNKKLTSLIDTKLSNMDLKYDDTPFFEAVRQYNDEILASIRGRLKTYLDILNPVAGSKDESVYTKIYRQAMEKIFNKANFTKEELTAIKLPPTNSAQHKTLDVLTNFFQRFASLSDEEYTNAIKEFVVEDKDNMVRDFIQKMYSKDNKETISKIWQLQGAANKPVFNILNKGLDREIESNIEHFMDVANANITSIKSKALICANLERRIKSGEFEEALKSVNTILGNKYIDGAAIDSIENYAKNFDTIPVEEWIKKARQLVYEGTVASDACKLELDFEHFQTLKNVIYDKNAFKKEIELVPDLEGLLRNLILSKTGDVDNSNITGICGLLRNSAKEMLNNRTWKKIFLPMTFALVAVTLLVQPLFGNIKDEFPETKKKGAK